MKISQKFELAAKEDRVLWSFEYFPPRTAQGLQNLYDRIERMRELGPEFIDITWGAGGKNSDLTLNLVQVCQQTIGMETCMHLCCTEMPEAKVKESLRIAKEHGCQNILALRGDPPHGQSEWKPTPGGFSKAIDLVKYIRAEYGDYFDVAVAGFPQGHPETADGEDDKRQEIEFLKAKVDAGANFIFTQMFYDVNIFIDWVKRVRAAGITVPIVPGIMPIQSWQKFMTWVKRENIIVPQHFWDVLNPVQDNDEAVRAVGIKLVAQMCRDILDCGLGIRGLHLYTLNLEKGARMLLEELKMEASREQVHPLPWRPSLAPKRRGEAIRPIFWANRQQSYLSRTEDWDEFPNGRWGDSRSPAYGDLDGYPVKIDVPGNDALELWGEPKQFSDITALFAKFCRNELKALPWSSQPASKETSVIDQQLAKMNELGYLTINSQPAVDGARSEDATHGWGPAGGYVYQKAYLEFFVAPALLDELVKRIEKDPRITYYAVNRQGDLRTNTHSEGPNAVTWGVFPGKEIIQPTIVEAVSFIAWKDEAFELGMQWASLYEEGSTSRQLIKDVMNDSYLVNIVANDFKDGLSIFEPFQLHRATPTIVTNAVNGVSNAVSSATETVAGAAGAVVNGVSSLVNGSGSATEKTNGHVNGQTNGHYDEKTNGAQTNGEKDSVYEVTNEDAVPPTAGQAKVNGSNSNQTEVRDSTVSQPTVESSPVSEPEAKDSAVNHGTGAGPAPKASKSLDELFDSVPLFMRETPSADGEENETLEALKSLIFDGTPDEIAENFKNQATERHQLGQLRDALGFYTQGIEAKPDDRQLRLSLLLNRAACNLSLGNYGSVLRDTGAALTESPNSPKAYFRAASALLALSRWNDALDCISRGKGLVTEAAEDKQKTWEGLEAKARKGLVGIEERTERERRDRVGKEALRRALQARGIIQIHSSAPPDNPTPAAFDDSNVGPTIPLVQAAENPVKWYPPSPDHPIVYPAFLMYPEHATSDLIARFHEDTTFYDQLEVMFPADAKAQQGGQWADWDKTREYHCDNLVVYAETHFKKLLKIGRSLTLRDVIAKAAALPPVGEQKDGLVMSDGLLSFVVLPKGAGEQKWVDNYKQSRGGA